MCMSPDEMSDDRIREAIEWYRNTEQAFLAVGDEKEASFYAAKVANFEALLAERERQLAMDVEEIFAAVVVEPQRVAVTV